MNVKNVAAFYPEVEKLGPIYTTRGSFGDLS
jgi:hypothetical protein